MIISPHALHAQLMLLLTFRRVTVCVLGVGVTLPSPRASANLCLEQRWVEYDSEDSRFPINLLINNISVEQTSLDHLAMGVLSSNKQTVGSNFKLSHMRHL